jgi:site-specific recombinase XerD
MGWVLRFLKYHRDQSGEWKHPRDLGPGEVVGFINHLANVHAVSASTQNQALNAMVFLYSQVLGDELGDLGEFLQASQRKSLSVVLSKAEVQRLLAALPNAFRLPGQVLYGTGMRLMEMLGHKDVSTTMIYTHVLNRPGLAVRSPLD